MILPNISNISTLFLLIGIIIGVFIGLYFGRKRSPNHFDGRLVIDQSENLARERWSYIFDTTPLDEIVAKDYIVVQIERIK